MAVTQEFTIQRFLGLSSDTKPTTCPVGSTFYETDLGTLYKTPDGGTTWVSTAGEKLAGNLNIFEKAITAAANAGATTVCTITSQSCQIESIVLRANATGQVDLTSAAITGGAGVITFLSAADAIQANINSINEQVSWSGEVILPATATISINLLGTGATAVNLKVYITYRPISDGGYLA